MDGLASGVLAASIERAFFEASMLQIVAQFETQDRRALVILPAASLNTATVVMALAVQVRYSEHGNGLIYRTKICRAGRWYAITGIEVPEARHSPSLPKTLVNASSYASFVGLVMSSHGLR